jgi:hypothetical protein
MGAEKKNGNAVPVGLAIPVKSLGNEARNRRNPQADIRAVPDRDQFLALVN